MEVNTIGVSWRYLSYLSSRENRHTPLLVFKDEMLLALDVKIAKLGMRSFVFYAFNVTYVLFIPTGCQTGQLCKVPEAL